MSSCEAIVRDVTLLWALRSPCNLGCRYCYFGTVEEHRSDPPTQAGQLSHTSRRDMSFAEIKAFLSTIGESSVKRVFLAGGEPLIWPRILNVIEILAAADVEVVLCTNGISLNRPHITEGIIDLGVDCVSISLDSTDPSYNDYYRPSSGSVHGWADVVSGIRALLAARGARSRPRIGLYAVITRRNIPAVGEVAALAARLELDYYVPQPISLAASHPLHEELSLRHEDVPALIAAMGDLYQADLHVTLPDRSYPDRFVSTVDTEPMLVASCFGGHTLFFIEPDGSVWDCPSSYKIAATPPLLHQNIRGQHAARMFGPARQTCARNCGLFSRDCVNMWPLMSFDRVIRPRISG